MSKAVVNWVAAAAVLVGGAGAWAQPPGGSPPRPPLKLQALSPTVYWAAEGSNIGVIIGDKGVVVFDTGASASRAKDLLAAIAKITPKPVDTVILSHVDGDHTGGLAAFPAGIRIISQANTMKAIQANAAAGKGNVPADRVPNQGVGDRENTTLDGVKVQLLHWAPAHTDGDLVLYLPDQKIVFAGDIYCLDQARAFIHPEEGGSTAGWIRSSRGVLALNADRFVPGHGTVQTKTALRKFTDVSAAERDRVKAGVAKGQSLAQIEAEVHEPPKSPTAPPHWEPFAQVVYEELTHRP